MTKRPFKDYIDSVLWKSVHKEWNLWYQCVWFFKDYMEKVLWIKCKSVGSAKEVWKNTFKPFDKNWTQIKWSKDLLQWDIWFFDTGRYGHVFIIKWITDTVTVYEQNGVGTNWKNKSWDGIWDNAVREHTYPLSALAWVWRCQKIFDNLQLERKYIEDKLTELYKKPENKDLTNTLFYQKSIRYVKS